MTSVSRDDWLTSEWLEADGLGGFASGSLAPFQSARRRRRRSLTVATGETCHDLVHRGRRRRDLLQRLGQGQPVDRTYASGRREERFIR